MVANTDLRKQHGQQDAFDLQVRIERPLDPLDRVHQAGNAFQRVVFALDRHQYRVRRRQRVQRQQAQAGRAVHKDEIVIVPDRTQEFLQVKFPLVYADQFYFCAGQPDIRAHKAEFLDLCLLDAVLQGCPSHHCVINGIALIHPAAEAAGGISLRIQVRHQHFLSRLRQRGGQVDGRCRFSDAALLVRNCDNLAHGCSFCPPVRA